MSAPDPIERWALALAAEEARVSLSPAADARIRRALFSKPRPGLGLLARWTPRVAALAFVVMVALVGARLLGAAPRASAGTAAGLVVDAAFTVDAEVMGADAAVSVPTMPRRDDRSAGPRDLP
ncbi:MAG: hypothetical protein U1E65_33280 [Myxococcota bacterium]